jgi:hypothetical protein
MKKHPKQHSKRLITFERESEKKAVYLGDERMVTAEGHQKFLLSCPATRSRSLYRGRRQGKK